MIETPTDEMTAQLAQPLYFGDIGRPLFGWFHEPHHPGTAGLGVLICNPFGYEALCTHRSVRHLAANAAAAGFPAMRFDYEGTGDSAGDDREANRLGAWVASVGTALDTLRDLTGVSRICLVGLRLGAMLAVLAAQTRADIAGVVAIAPVVRGRTYLRELRAMALARPQVPPPSWANLQPGLQEAAGFELTAQTCADVSAIDLVQIYKAPAARVLVLERDDLRTSEAWGAHLGTLGVLVDVETFRGYAAMTLSAHENIVPTEMIATTLQWIRRLALPTPVPPSPTEKRMSFDVGGIRESIVRPDGDPALFGILTENNDPPRNVVLLLNAGAISHIGPGRLHVTLARHLARQGIAVLRLDIRGIGDSNPPPGEPENIVYATHASADVAVALDYLRRRYGRARYHVVGICSGAYHGFKAAVAGHAFDTAVVINPLTFFWKAGMSLAEPEFHVAAESARYRTIALRLNSWRKLLRGDVDVRALVRILLRSNINTLVHELREIARWIHIPVRDDLASELKLAVNPARCIFFIFGSNDPGFRLLRDQGGSAVRRLRQRGRIKLAIVEGADHTFTAHWSRERLIQLVTTHLREPSDADPG